MPLCIVVGAGSKYASNPAFGGKKDGEDQSFLEIEDADIRWGLGGGIGIKFATKGYNICLMSRKLANLKPMENYINETFDVQAKSIVCDVSSDASVKKAFQECINVFNNEDIEVLVYNPGMAPDTFGGLERVENLNLGQFDMAMQVHAHGLVRCSKEVLPSMKERQKGTILVSGNTMCIRGKPRFGLFSPSKFAQRSICQVMVSKFKLYFSNNS